MKKSLIAVAALAAVSAASAQSSVTLYGLIDIGYGSQKTETRNGSVIRSQGLVDGSLSGNRIGFRGTEDLGGGLKAHFVIEEGIAPTSGSLLTQRNGSAGQTAAGAPAFGGTIQAGASAYTAANNRQSYVGLSSATMGTFNIGYQYTNIYELGTLAGYHIGSEGIAGGFVHNYGNTSFGGTRANSLTYISPNFAGGFTVRAQYGSGLAANALPPTGSNTAVSLSGNTGGTAFETTGRRYSLMGQYANGPLSVALAYTSLRNTTTAAGSSTNHSTNLGASYDFGVAKVGGTYIDGRTGANATTAASKLRAYQVGVAVPFGAIVPYITYGRGRTDVDGGGRTVDLKQVQAGVRYSLSKRTTAYAMYGRTTDDGNLTSVPVAVGASGIVNRDTKTVVGLQHTF